MRFTTVLFDLDHTLLDSDDAERLAFDATLGSVGVERPEQHLPIYRRINTALWRQVELGSIRPDDVKTRRFAELAVHLGLDASPVELGERYLSELPEHGELYEHALTLLEALGHVRLGLVTNGIGVVQRRRIERLQLGDHFGSIAISGEVGVAKPNPEIFSHLGLDEWNPESTVMIGDSLSSDIAAGNNAGVATCWYNPARLANPGAARPTTEVASLADIPAALTAL